MSSDWQEYQLGELFKVKHGFAFKGEFFTETPQKYVLVTPGNFAIGGGFQLAKLKYYNGPIPDEYVLKPGQVVVTMTDLSKQADTLGYAGIIPSDDFIWLHNQRVGLLEFNGRVQVDPVFISYLLRSHDYRAWIVGSATGTTVKHTSPGRIEAFKCRIPSIESQKEIGESFKAIDDKIKLNRQINQTLEQIAQAMFKSWFVDFEPTRAKIAAKEAGGDQAAIEQAAMCAISGKTPDQLNQSPPETLAQLKATAALFPDALVDSELGEIPEGWEVKALSSIIDIIGGGTPKRSEETYWNGDIPWFSVRDVPASGDIFVVDTEEKISKLGLQKSSTKLLPVGTTIISARGTVGKLAFVGTPMCMNQSCYGIRGRDGFGPFFTYFNLREAVDTLLRNVHGAVFDTITTQTFESYSMAVSAEGLSKQFDLSVAPLLNRIELNVRENITLSHLRDSLLPKLLSGDFEFNQCKTIA